MMGFSTRMLRIPYALGFLAIAAGSSGAPALAADPLSRPDALGIGAVKAAAAFTAHRLRGFS